METRIGVLALVEILSRHRSSRVICPTIGATKRRTGQNREGRRFVLLGIMAGHLFRTSRWAYRQVTELFDFVTPTAAALWNLRWQVVGFCSHHPAASVQVLDDRFVSGSGLHGANLRRACIDTSWEYQQQQFAKFLLISLFSIYEG